MTSKERKRALGQVNDPPKPSYEGDYFRGKVDFREMKPMVVTEAEEEWMQAHHGSEPWPDHWLRGSDAR